MSKPEQKHGREEGEDDEVVDERLLEIDSLREFLLSHFDASDIDDILPPNSGLDELAHLEALALPEGFDDDEEEDDYIEDFGEEDLKEIDNLKATTQSPKSSRKKFAKLILGGLDRFSSDNDMDRALSLKPGFMKRTNPSRLSSKALKQEQLTKPISITTSSTTSSSSSSSSHSTPLPFSPYPTSTISSSGPESPRHQGSSDQTKGLTIKNRSQQVPVEASPPSLRKFLTPSNRIVLCNFAVNVRSQLENISSQNLNEDPFIISLWTMAGSVIVPLDSAFLSTLSSTASSPRALSPSPPPLHSLNSTPSLSYFTLSNSNSHLPKDVSSSSTSSSSSKKHKPIQDVDIILTLLEPIYRLRVYPLRHTLTIRQALELPKDFVTEKAFEQLFSQQNLSPSSRLPEKPLYFTNSSSSMLQLSSQFEAHDLAPFLRLEPSGLAFLNGFFHYACSDSLGIDILCKLTTTLRAVHQSHDKDSRASLPDLLKPEHLPTMKQLQILTLHPLSQSSSQNNPVMHVSSGYNSICIRRSNGSFEVRAPDVILYTLFGISPMRSSEQNTGDKDSMANTGKGVKFRYILGKRVKKLAMGACHMAFILEDDSVALSGINFELLPTTFASTQQISGQLALDRESKRIISTPVLLDKSLYEGKPLDVVCSFASTVLITTVSTYTFGSRQYEQLGREGSGHIPGEIFLDPKQSVDVVCVPASGTKKAHKSKMKETSETDQPPSSPRFFLSDDSVSPHGGPSEVIMPKIKIVQVACGDFHKLALSEEGSIWGWGSNNYQQLTNKLPDPLPVPTRISIFEDPSATSPLRFVQVVCGNLHSMALTTTGRVHTWGSNLFGQLGRLPPKKSRLVHQDGSPLPIKFNDGLTPSPIICHIAAHALSSAAITTSGLLFLWGSHHHSFGSFVNSHVEDDFLSNPSAPVFTSHHNPSQSTTSTSSTSTSQNQLSQTPQSGSTTTSLNSLGSTTGASISLSSSPQSTLNPVLQQNSTSQSKHRSSKKSSKASQFVPRLLKHIVLSSTFVQQIELGISHAVLLSNDMMTDCLDTLIKSFRYEGGYNKSNLLQKILQIPSDSLSHFLRHLMLRAGKCLYEQSNRLRPFLDIDPPFIEIEHQIMRKKGGTAPDPSRGGNNFYERKITIRNPTKSRLKVTLLAQGKDEELQQSIVMTPNEFVIERHQKQTIDLQIFCNSKSIADNFALYSFIVENEDKKVSQKTVFHVSRAFLVCHIVPTFTHTPATMQIENFRSLYTNSGSGSSGGESKTTKTTGSLNVLDPSVERTANRNSQSDSPSQSRRKISKISASKRSNKGSKLMAQLATYVPQLVLRRAMKRSEPPRSERPECERFAAAILFVDISGFTQLNEHLGQLGGRGPEIVSRHISSYFTSLIAAVDEHGGDTLKFAGDALICMFSHDTSRPSASSAQRPSSLAQNINTLSTPIPLVSNSKSSPHILSEDTRSTSPLGSPRETRNLALSPRRSSSPRLSYSSERVETPVEEEQEDDLTLLTLKAVQCAFDIQTRLAVYDRSEEGIKLSLHVGVGAGDLWALFVGGVNGAWEFLVCGEPLAQLRSCVDLSQSGEVVVSSQAWDLIQHHSVGVQRGDHGDWHITSITQPTPPRPSNPLSSSPSSSSSSSSSFSSSFSSNSSSLTYMSASHLPAFNSSTLVSPSALTPTMERRGTPGGPNIPFVLDRHLESAIRCFVPPTVQVMLDSSGSTEWMDELRTVTVLFVKLDIEPPPQHSKFDFHSPTSPTSPTPPAQESPRSSSAKTTHPMVPRLQRVKAITGDMLLTKAALIRKDEKAIEQWSEKLHKVLASMQTIIFRYQGIVRQFLADDKGTVLIGAFGLPFSHADDPLRGVRASLEIHEALNKMNINNAIGVATGLVFCGAVGSSCRREYAMVGDIVNLAARLMSFAYSSSLFDPPTPTSPSSSSSSSSSSDSSSGKGRNRSNTKQTACGSVKVLCDQTTFDGCKTKHTFKSLEAIKVKGKDKLIPIYQPFESMNKANHLRPLRPSSAKRLRSHPNLQSSLVTPVAVQSRSEFIVGREEEQTIIRALLFQLSATNSEAADQPSEKTTTSSSSSSSSSEGYEIEGGSPRGRRRTATNLAAVFTKKSINSFTIVIEGETGMGKSLLVSFAMQLAVCRKIQVLYSCGDSILRRGSATPFQSWKSILSDLLEIDQSSLFLRSSSSSNLVSLSSSSLVSPLQTRYYEILSEVCPKNLTEYLYILNDILPLNLPKSEGVAALSPQETVLYISDIIKRLLKARSLLNPLLLVIEDAQWMDSLSLSLTVEVASSITNLLVLVTNKPPSAEHQQRPSAIASLISHPRSFHLALKPLSLEQATQLASCRLGVKKVPDEIRPIIQKAEGNPFFLNELMAALRDSGFVAIVTRSPSLSKTDSGVKHKKEKKKKEGEGELGEEDEVEKKMKTSFKMPRMDSHLELRIVRDLQDLALPSTLHGLMASRIDELPPQQQMVLKVAAVIGMEFDIQTLKFIYPNDITQYDLLLSLQSLMNLEFISPLDDTEDDDDAQSLSSSSASSSDHTVPEAPVNNNLLSSFNCFTFRSSSLHEVAYSRLLYSYRQSLHRQIAEMYEEQVNHGFFVSPALLAHHWLRTVEGAAKVEQEVLNKTINYMKIASEVASRHMVQDSKDSNFWLKKALTMIDTLPTSQDDSKRRKEQLQLRVMGMALKDLRSFTDT